MGRFDYHVSVRRFDRPTAFLAYPLSMGLRLPPLAIPLLPGDPDVTVDLQAVFDRAYDECPYYPGNKEGHIPTRSASEGPMKSSESRRGSPLDD